MPWHIGKKMNEIIVIIAFNNKLYSVRLKIEKVLYSRKSIYNRRRLYIIVFKMGFLCSIIRKHAYALLFYIIW
jgi:hypothetical protein